MTDDDDLTPDQVRDRITTWGVANAQAQAAVVEKARKVSLRWYVVSVSVAALVSALLTVGITVAVLAVVPATKISISRFAVDLVPGGGRQVCTRDSRSSDEDPGYVCRAVG